MELYRLGKTALQTHKPFLSWTQVKKTFSPCYFASSRLLFLLLVSTKAQTHLVGLSGRARQKKKSPLSLLTLQESLYLTNSGAEKDATLKHLLKKLNQLSPHHSLHPRPVSSPTQNPAPFPPPLSRCHLPMRTSLCRPVLVLAASRWTQVIVFFFSFKNLF